MNSLSQPRSVTTLPLLAVLLDGCYLLAPRSSELSLQRHQHVGEKLEFEVQPNEKSWALTVMAVPKQYEAQTRQEEEAGKFPRHPFALEIKGAKPGFVD